jgi:hypothetical protein
LRFNIGNIQIYLNYLKSINRKSHQGFFVNRNITLDPCCFSLICSFGFAEFTSFGSFVRQNPCYFLFLDKKKVTKEKSRLQRILGRRFFSLCRNEHPRSAKAERDPRNTTRGTSYHSVSLKQYCLLLPPLQSGSLLNLPTRQILNARPCSKPQNSRFIPKFYIRRRERKPEMVRTSTKTVAPIRPV